MSSYGPPGYAPPPGYNPQQGPPFGQPQMGPPKKKGMSTGCIIAIVAVLLFFGGIGAVVLAIGFAVSQDKDVQNVVGAIGDAAKIAADAQNAPGTAELRALGCEQALAIDPVKMLKIADRFVDAGSAPPSATPPDVTMMVMCQVGTFGVPPACDDAARAYVRGASPRGKFMLSVQRGSNKSTQCSGMYSASGALLGPGSGTP
jgi:hypothetical protein